MNKNFNEAHEREDLEQHQDRTENAFADGELSRGKGEELGQERGTERREDRVREAIPQVLGTKYKNRIL